MNPADWKNIKQILSATLDLPEAERRDFLAREANGEIRKEVEKLLKAHEKAENFIEKSFADEYGLRENGFEENLVGKQIDNYKILEKIGEGGMGTVFLAEHTEEEFSQKVALKLIKRGMDTNAVLKRFLMERQILASLEHPNIARLLDGGSTKDGLPYFVMEYVEGENIREFCDNHQFDTNERLGIFQKVCQAIAHAHQKLIVHRDIKPSNIIVTNDGTPKLLDFGIAKLLSPDWNAATTEATATNFRLMTPEYASPEQLRGKMTTTSTDIYSLGVVLYELLTGARPFNFKGKNPIEAAEEILTKEPLYPSSVVSRPLSVAKNTNKNEGQRTTDKGQNPKSLRGDLDNIILKAIRKEPENRYQSVAEFADDIHRYLTGLPVKAMADTRFYRLQKFVKRHRQGVLVGLLATMIIFSVSGFAVWQGIVAAREHEKAKNRLIEIRNVAKSLMNETNDSLAKIPGNVAVQKGLAEKSVALLDSLAKEETSDTALLAELADAYTKLANIQIWAFREFENAGGNLEKAETIYQKILLSNPDDIEIRSKVYTAHLRHIESLHDTNRREEMFKVGLKAIENRREMIRIEPENPSNFASLAAMYGWFGDKYLLFGRLEESVENYRQGAEIIDQAIEKQFPKINSAEAKAEFARLYFIKAWLINGAGDFEKGIEFYRKSAEIAGEVFRQNPAIEGNFWRVAASYQNIAEIYEKRNDFQSALEAYLTARKLVDEGFKKKELPEYGNLFYWKCFYTVYAGKMSAQKGNKNEARNYFIEGETVCRENISQDETDAANLFESLPYFYEITDFFVAVGEKERAANQLLNLSRKLENVLEKNKSDLKTAFSLAEIFEKLGDVSSDSKSREYYEKSVKIWNEYSRENTLLPEEIKKKNRTVSKLRK